ncbi:MAG: hypothetical protein NC453_21745 [Muribaculum sp.]|nr:hypothetical protein [Muribaculum sp.]
MNNLRQQLYQTALAAGLPIVGLDTAAKILAVTYVHGNNEFMTYNEKFLAEIHYIQQKWNIDGGLTPDNEMIILIKKYVSELEQNEKDNPKTPYAPWAIELFKERYGVELIN